MNISDFGNTLCVHGCPVSKEELFICVLGLGRAFFPTIEREWFLYKNRQMINYLQANSIGRKCIEM